MTSQTKTLKYDLIYVIQLLYQFNILLMLRTFKQLMICLIILKDLTFHKNGYSTTQEQRRISPLKSWLCTHGQTSLNKFLQMDGDFDKPMLFTAETPQRKFVAYIDPENKFCIEDKLSQVSTNIQLHRYVYKNLKTAFLYSRHKLTQICSRRLCMSF